MPDDRTRMSTTPHEERQDEFIDLTASEELADLPFAGGRVIAWRSAWQLPVAFVSIVLIAVGLWTIKQGIVLPDKLQYALLRHFPCVRRRRRTLSRSRKWRRQ